MSRATSGLDISAARSAIRFSNSVISASIVSGPRGFLMILTRDDAVTDVEVDLPFLRFDPSADGDRAESIFSPCRPPATAVDTDFIPARVDVIADCSSSLALLNRAACQS